MLFTLKKLFFFIPPILQTLPVFIEKTFFLQKFMVFNVKPFTPSVLPKFHQQTFSIINKPIKPSTLRVVITFSCFRSMEFDLFYLKKVFLGLLLLVWEFYIFYSILVKLLLLPWPEKKLLHKNTRVNFQHRGVTTYKLEPTNFVFMC